MCGTTIDSASGVITDYRPDITQKGDGRGKTSGRGVMFLLCFESVWADRHKLKATIHWRTLSPNHYSLPLHFPLHLNSSFLEFPFLP